MFMYYVIIIIQTLDDLYLNNLKTVDRAIIFLAKLSKQHDIQNVSHHYIRICTNAK